MDGGLFLYGELYLDKERYYIVFYACFVNACLKDNRRQFASYALH